jgi:alpha-L-fucosidase 2
VRVQLTGANYLSLAEVQVFGTGAPAFSNLAQGRAATQSSTLPGFAATGAAGAVDGNLDGNFGDGSVTATNLDPNAWWQVDLGASAAVSSVVVWNRADCCSSRLNDYWVFVSDTPFGATDTPGTLQGRVGTFSSHQTAAPNPSAVIAAGVRGRYVRVQLTGANYLSLAEVQVFGQ